MYFACRGTPFLKFNDMFKYSKDGISVLAVLDRRRVKLNGKFPVKIEVVHRRRQKYFPTGIDMTGDEWKDTGALAESEMAARVESVFMTVRAAVETLVDDGTFSLAALTVRMGRNSSVTVNSALQTMMERLRQEGRVNSYYRCRSTLRSIERYAGKKVLLRDITVTWLRHCESFWRDEGKSDTTISIYMKTVKSIINLAVRKGYMRESTSPFGKGRYLIPKGSGRKLALTKAQIKKIIDFKGSDKQEMYRDLWLFSYLCNGINFKDMLFLKYRNVVNGEICFVRSKTVHAYGHSKVIHAVMSHRMQAIINRWGNPYDGNPDTYIFPYASDVNDNFTAAHLVRKIIYLCNCALHKIARKLGIPSFSTYSARHSFATVLQRSGTAISFISESLGHSSLAVTECYLAGFDYEDRLKNSAVLTDFD